MFVVEICFCDLSDEGDYSIPKLYVPFPTDFCDHVAYVNGLSRDFFGSSWGIYPDLLHIADLQLSHDVISSCLIEMSESGSGPRDQQLQPLWNNYEKWCASQRSMAKTFFVGWNSLCNWNPSKSHSNFFGYCGGCLWFPAGSWCFKKTGKFNPCEEFHFILELLGSYSQQKLWRQGGHHIVAYPKRSWRGQQPAWWSLGCVVCCLHPTMVPFTTSTSTKNLFNFFCELKEFPQMLQLIRNWFVPNWLCVAVELTIWGIGLWYAFHWLLSTRSVLNTGRFTNKFALKLFLDGTQKSLPFSEGFSAQALSYRRRYWCFHKQGAIMIFSMVCLQFFWSPHLLKLVSGAMWGDTGHRKLHGMMSTLPSDFKLLVFVSVIHTTEPWF